MYPSTQLLKTLSANGRLEREAYLELLHHRKGLADTAAEMAREVRKTHYGNEVYIRGLIEISNICRNDCTYCGIRRSNRSAVRYRLTSAQILSCCRAGYALGFRTFVMQGGEDAAFTDEVLVSLLRQIKAEFPDCAVTLSLGERSFKSYAALRGAGADRYLLRHEACSAALYEKLHPAEMSHENRMRCLRDLRALGYQVGTGFMVGAPFQTIDDLADELCFLQEFRPEMVGIGPFLPHHDTPFCDRPAGSADLTVFLLSLIRLMLPRVLLPSTTALNSISADGRIRGLLAGANVVMPNLSPADTRALYQLYDNKKSAGLESAEAMQQLRESFAAVGFEIVTARGDYREAAPKKP